MKKIFTLQFLVNSIHQDQVVKQLSFDTESVEESFFEVPDRCINSIMNFARSYRVVETETAGLVEMNMN